MTIRRNYAACDSQLVSYSLWPFIHGQKLGRLWVQIMISGKDF